MVQEARGFPEILTCAINLKFLKYEHNLTILQVKDFVTPWE